VLHPVAGTRTNPQKFFASFFKKEVLASSILPSPPYQPPDRGDPDMTTTKSALASVVARRADAIQAFRIAAGDTNYFACLFDPVADGVTFTLVVEIFEPGGATPPNTHAIAEECFFVLAGEGLAECGGASMPIAPGDSFVLRPGSEHKVTNTGPGKLYCLTFMTPNEGFAELIHGGIPVTLGADDLAVIRGHA